MHNNESSLESHIKCIFYEHVFADSSIEIHRKALLVFCHIAIKQFGNELQGLMHLPS